VNLPSRPVLIAIGAGALVTTGAAAWLGRDLWGSPSSASGRPSLMELLDEVRQSPPPRPILQGKPAPKPPAHGSWTTPLNQACVMADPALMARLQQQFAKFDRTRTKVSIDPSNYGRRYSRDAFGNPINPTPQIVVLHETVYSMDSAVGTFMTPHPNDDDQVSYHTLVGQDGKVLDLVDPARRAFGAGNSSFNGRWVITNRKVGGSVNNFALHLSLETPPDGENESPGHSGYTQAQYDAVALVLADWMRRYQIPPQNITTHRYVDLGGERSDPRSFHWNELEQRLSALGVLC